MLGLLSAMMTLMAAASTYSAYESHQSGKRQKKAAARAEEQAQAAEAEATKVKEDEDRNRLQAVMRNQARRRTGEPGLRSTILTGPLGVTGNAQTAGKTLLGM